MKKVANLVTNSFLDLVNVTIAIEKNGILQWNDEKQNQFAENMPMFSCQSKSLL